MEIPCFKCQLLNAGRRDFSQWIKNSLGSRLLWGKEEKWSHGRITIILTDSSSLLALYVHFFCDIVPPFYFLPDPSNLSARSLDNGIQQKLQEEILLQQNDQCSDIQPPFWSHCTLSVSMGRSWGYGRVSVCVCVWVFVRELSSAVSLQSFAVQEQLVTSRVCCRSRHLLRLSGNCWCGIMDFAINGNE